MKKMQDRLDGKDRRFSVEAYVSKCRSALYEAHDAEHPMTTRMAFELAQKRRPSAGRYWLSRLRALDDQSISAILDRVPEERCSALHQRFARRIVELNRQFLLARAPESHD